MQTSTTGIGAWFNGAKDKLGTLRDAHKDKASDLRKARLTFESLRHPKDPETTFAFAIADATTKPLYVTSKDWTERQRDVLLSTICYLVGAIALRFKDTNFPVNAHIDARNGGSRLLIDNLMRTTKEILLEHRSDSEPTYIVEQLTNTDVFKALSADLEHSIVGLNASALMTLGSYTQKKANGQYSQKALKACTTVFDSVFRAIERANFRKLDPRVLALQLACACKDAALNTVEFATDKIKKPATFDDLRRNLEIHSQEDLAGVDRAQKFRDLYILSLAKLCLSYCGANESLATD